MTLPFTPEQFLNVFQSYNLSVWPLQILIVLLGAAAVYLASGKHASSGRIIAGILSAFWLWMGIVYHILFFAAINPAAYVFGSLFVLQGIVFLYAGVAARRLSFRFRADIYGIAGSVLILYAMVLYPSLGYLLGHVYPQSPTFGLPCPTTIFTFGMLLWTDRKFPAYLLVIPCLWAVIGFSAALSLGIREDIGLLVAGITCVILVTFRNRTHHQPEEVLEHAL